MDEPRYTRKDKGISDFSSGLNPPKEKIRETLFTGLKREKLSSIAFGESTRPLCTRMPNSEIPQAASIGGTAQRTTPHAVQFSSGVTMLMSERPEAASR